MLNALPFLHYLPLTRRVYAYYCAGLCCMILCAAEERPLFNSVETCKNYPLISSVVLYFVPTGNMETNHSFSVVHVTKDTSLSFISIFWLYCCEKFTPEFFLSDAAQWFCNIILAFVLQLKYIKLFRQQSLSVCESNQKTWSHDMIIMGRLKQCKQC